MLPGVGAAGQAKLTAARVVVVGCGGLGGPAAVYLAAAGVGHLRLVDGDEPEESNLHRQVFFSSNAAGSKTEQLAAHIGRLNPTIKVQHHSHRLAGGNVRALLRGADLVLDCTDNARTKHLINDACVVMSLPLVYAAAQGFGGYVALFENRDPDGINLRDLYPEPDPTLPDCATTGVLPTAVGTLSLLQANAALCYLLGIGEPPVDRLLTYSVLDNTQHRVKLKKTYTKPITLPEISRVYRRETLEIVTDSLSPEGFDGIFSMLSPQREPDLPDGVTRLSDRNPLGDCLEQMGESGRYLIYCNSGKLSLVLASQLRGERPELEVYSLKGGVVGLAGSD